MRADTAAIALDSGKRALVAFGPFVFDRSNRLLARDGVEVPLPPRVLGVLALLIDRPGQLVTKQELMSAVWREAFVTETSLAEAISVLRQTLGDDPHRPTYIQTLHRRGYRFVGEVRDPAATGHPLEGGSDENNRSVRLQPEEQPRLAIFFPWTVTFFAVMITASAVWKYVDTAATPARPMTRFTLSLPAGLTLSTAGGAIAVSRDGAVIAFAGCKEADCGIYLRPLAQAEPTRVAGTTGGASPFFSHDGRWLGYFAGGRLHKVALAGGSPVTLADAREPLGATWTRDGQIVFAGNARGGLSVVPANGGMVRPLTEPDAGGASHRWPAAIPDGSAIVFTVAGGLTRTDQQYAAILSLRTRAWGRLLDDVSAIRAPIAGYLIAQRGSDLVGVAFDERARSVSGLPVLIAPGAVEPHTAPHFATSEAGTFVIVSGRGQVHVVLDWNGELRRLVPPAAPALLR